MIICCDNSLPHLLKNEEILQSLQNMKSMLRKNGLLLISIRDYDFICSQNPIQTGLFYTQTHTHTHTVVLGYFFFMLFFVRLCTKQTKKNGA